MKKLTILILCLSLIIGVCGCTNANDNTSSLSSTTLDEITIDNSLSNNNNEKPDNTSSQQTVSDNDNSNNNSQNTDSNITSSNLDAPSNNTSSQEKPNSNAGEKPEVTIFTAVAKDIYIVGGKCPLNTEYISISGDDVKTAKIKPIQSNDAAYFIGQAKILDSTMINIQGKQSGKDLSEPLSMFAIYDDSRKNLMMSNDYMPYFAADTRMHYYSAILSYTLSNEINSDEKEVARQNISYIVDSAKSVGAEVIYLVVPSSAAVYPETIPEFKVASGESIYKAFEKIATDCGAKVIYPLDTMTAHKNDGKGYTIYHNTDSHWSPYGAYLGVSELMNYISKKHPAAKPRTVSEMGFYTVELFAGDSLFSFGDNTGFENYSTADLYSGATSATGIKELTALYKLKMPTDTLSQITRGKKSTYLTWDNSYERQFTNSNGAGLPKALIVRDSFGRTAFDMVNDRFSRVEWLAEGDYTSVATKIKSDTNYVIYIVSERNLLKVMHNNKDISLTSRQ